MWQFWEFRSHARWILLSGVNQQAPMHQLRMRQFKPFWGWTKNPSSSPAQGFFSPLLFPKILPSYLPPPLLPTSPLLPPSPHFLFTPSQEFNTAPKLEPHELCDTRLEEGGELNIVGTWRVQHWKNKEKTRQEERFITNVEVREERKAPSFLCIIFFLCFCFCLRRRRHCLLF